MPLNKSEAAQANKFQDAIGVIVDQYLQDGMKIDTIREVLLDEAGSDLEARKKELEVW